MQSSVIGLRTWSRSKMKGINYRCKDCLQYEEEVLHQDSDTDIPTILVGKYCPMCGGILGKFNFKKNKHPQRYYYCDPHK